MISFAQPKTAVKPVIEIDGSMFRISKGFTVAAVIITGILAALYTVFW